MVLTDHQLLIWLGRFLWPFLRITGVLLTEPFFASTMVPMRMKAMMAAMLAGALAFWLPNLPAFPDDPPTVIYQGAMQIGLGALMGLVMRIVVLAIASLGEIAGLAMGLSFAELQFQDASGNTQVLYDVMSWVGLMGYVAAGGPIWLLGAIAHSFGGGAIGISGATWPAILSFGGSLMTSAVLLAVPVLAVTLVINITVGLLAVFAPQLNLLTIGFPMLILGGLSMLTASLFSIQGGVERLLNMAVRIVASAIHHG